MHILHVTPHLPPDQAANALLPFHLGNWAVQAGHRVEYLAHQPRTGAPFIQPGPVSWVPSRHQSSRLLRATKLASLHEAWRIVRQAGASIAAADVIHIHSNGLL